MRNQLLAFIAMGFLLAGNATAGAFIAADQNTTTKVTHPTPYLGTGGAFVVTICIDPASPFAAQAEPPLKNVAATWSNFQSTSGNLRFGANNNIPASEFDVESVMLHESGHCIGLAHPNAASESGLTGVQAESTKADFGPDAGFTINPGLDTLHGSLDDIRGDDVNLHWFQTNVNNPFLVPALIDRSNFSAVVSGRLPVGHLWVVNQERAIAASPIYNLPNTEAVMQQGQFNDEMQRTLGADDVVTRRIAMAGRDGIQGNADDYTASMQYVGLTTSCNIVVRFNTLTSFARCGVSFTSLPGSATDSRVTSGAMDLNSGTAWFFNNEVIFANGFQQ